MSEVIHMTDEQFATYNKLLELVDSLIERLPEKDRDKFKQEKKDILLKK